MKQQEEEKNFLLKCRLADVVVYLYNNSSVDPYNVEILLQRMYKDLSAEAFSEKTIRIEYIVVLYCIVNYGLSLDLQTRILQAIETGDGFDYLLSKSEFLNDFVRVYENIRGFDASLKQQLAKLENEGKIEKVVTMTDEYRHDFLKGCKRLFKEMTYMISISMIE